MDLHIIYTDTDVIISKKLYNSWREIQDEYATYKTSLGAWSIDKVVDFLQSEYKDLDPNASVQVNELIKSVHLTATLRYEIKNSPKNQYTKD
jgi:hypothetical protein